MTKRYLKFIYYYLLMIFLFCTCCYIHAKLTNYFYQKKTHTIKTYSTQELKDKWLAIQPELFIQNINVESRDDIPKIMELSGINGVSISSTNPSYNSDYSNCIIWNLKNPQNGLLGVYFKPRTNPFKITYPHSHNEYTLDELLTHKIAIEKAYVFWDISKAKIYPNVDSNIINLEYDVDTTKEAALGCYNAIPNGVIIVPYSDNKNIFCTQKFNENKKLVKETFYKPDGKTITQINEYNENGQKTKVKFYQDDGKTILAIEEYNENGQKTKVKFYQDDGKTILAIEEYNENGQKNKETFYKPDGKTITQINEYNENKKLVKSTNYQDDGKTITQINEYNENGQKTKVKFYQDDGKTITQINEYNENGQKTKVKFYQDDGKTILAIEEYNENGQKTKATLYQDDGKTITKINEYNENEKLVKSTNYQDDGKNVIKKIIKFLKPIFAKNKKDLSRSIKMELVKKLI
jgi:antitoxin component YwqK of YwqJK toxin-antitoxin module